MTRVRAIAYVTGNVEGFPHLLVEKIPSGNQYSCIQATVSQTQASQFLHAEIVGKTNIMSTNLINRGCIATFVDYHSKNMGVKTNLYAIYVFQLPEKYSIPENFSLLPLSHAQNQIAPPLNHGIRLLKHSYQEYICSSSCNQPVQEKAIAFITRGSGKNTEILLLKKNAQLNNKGTNVGENEVVGGTVEKGEDPKIALMREMEEEAGIQSDKLVIEDKLTTYTRYNPHTKKINVRHVYHCALKGKQPNQWSYAVKGSGTDKNDLYNFEFVRLFNPLKIDAGLGQGIDLLKRKMLVNSINKTKMDLKSTYTSPKRF